MRLSSEARVGAVILLSVVILTGMVMAIGQIEIGQPEGNHLHLIYSHVDGLREGAPVRYAGVNVGRVSYIDLTPAGVKVGLRLTREVHIPQDSRFVIATAGVLGDKHIEIYPGSASEFLSDQDHVRGESPMLLDGILAEMKSTLQGLNRVVGGLADVADSDELHRSIVESSIVLQETLVSLKMTVDQVNEITLSVRGMADQAETFAAGLSDLDMARISKDIEAFSGKLAAVDLEGSFNEMNEFLSELRQLPIRELSDEILHLSRNLSALDLQTPLTELNEFAVSINEMPIRAVVEDLQGFTHQLKDVDLRGMESELRDFTGMLSQLDLVPLVDEITGLTRQLSSLDLAARGQEISVFTQRLEAFPLEEIGDDLQILTASMRSIPVEEIGASLRKFSDELESAPLEDLVANLTAFSVELKELGLGDMAAEVSQFTGQLSSLDIQSTFSNVEKDISEFSQRLAALELEYLYQSISATADNLQALSGAVDPDSLRRITADIETSTALVADAAQDFNNFAERLSLDASVLTEDTMQLLRRVDTAVESLELMIRDVHGFVDDVTAEGETAQSIRRTLAVVERTADEIGGTMELINQEIPHAVGMFEGLRGTMESIRKLDEDLRTVRTWGEQIDVKSQFGLNYRPRSLEDGRTDHLAAGAQFEFHPKDLASFFVVGLHNRGETGNFQLQYGREGTVFRQRYGIIDNRLGVALDVRPSDRWGVSAELRNISLSNPELRLKADFQWLPDWWFSIQADDIFELRERGVYFGIERRF